MVKYLVEKCGFDIGIKNHAGETAANIADSKNHVHIAAYLAEKNVFRNQSDECRYYVPYNECHYYAPHNNPNHRRRHSFNLSAVESFEPLGPREVKSEVKSFPSRRRYSYNFSSMESFEPLGAREVKASPETDLIDISLSSSEEKSDDDIDSGLSDQGYFIPETKDSLQFFLGKSHQTELDLSRLNHPINEDIITLIAKKFPKLVSLNCNNCDSINAASIMNIVSYLPKLTSLNLNGCENVDDSTILVIAAGFSRLASLKLNYCNKITDIAIESVAKKMTKLANISLIDCNQITDAAVTKLRNERASAVIIGKPRREYETKSHANKVKQALSHCHVM